MSSGPPPKKCGEVAVRAEVANPPLSSILPAERQQHQHQHQHQRRRRRRRRRRWRRWQEQYVAVAPGGVFPLSLISSRHILVELALVVRALAGTERRPNTHARSRMSGGATSMRVREFDESDEMRSDLRREKRVKEGAGGGREEGGCTLSASCFIVRSVCTSCSSGVLA